MEDKYDLIVFGVTGYTGKFVAEELYRIQTSDKQSLNWAVAARSEDKAAKALQDLGIEGIDILVADVNDETSIEAMCSKTKVLMDVVGPYVDYGEVVVKSCIKVTCDYVDITGETYFTELMLARYGDLAKEAGVYIVNFCGFDCIPNDLGTLLLQKAFNGKLAYIESFIKSKASAINTGTWESLLRSMKLRDELENLRKSQPRAKLPDVRMPKRGSVFYSNTVHSWCVPFLGADRACVLRSAQYRATEETPMIRAQMYMCVGSLFRIICMAAAMMVIKGLSCTTWGYSLLSRFPGFFSFGIVRKGGPTKQEVMDGSFTVTIDGTGFSVDCPKDQKKPDSKLRVKIRGAEPGYVATSAMMVQSALCLLDERNKLPKEGGIYTPAAAFGNTNIIQNLEATGKIKFTIEQIK